MTILIQAVAVCVFFQGDPVSLPDVLFGSELVARDDHAQVVFVHFLVRLVAIVFGSWRGGLAILFHSLLFW